MDFESNEKFNSEIQGFLPSNRIIKELFRWLGMYALIFIGSAISSSIFMGILIGIFPCFSIENIEEQAYFITSILLEVLFAAFFIRLLYLKPRKITWREIGFRRCSFKKYFFYGIGGGIFLFFLMIFLAIILPQANEVQDITKSICTAENPFYLGFLFVSTVFFAPLVEETVFRGILYKGLMDFIPKVPAIMVTGVLFGVIHMSLIRAIPIAIGGMLLCILYDKTKSLWVNITAHGLWNALMFLMTLFTV